MVKKKRKQAEAFESGSTEVDLYNPSAKIINFSKSPEEKRLIIVLEKAALETIKVNSVYELLDCEKHYRQLLDSGRDPVKHRPDILHQCLLMLLDSPLNHAGLLQVYVHAANGELIEVHPQTRLPRTHSRFCGLMAQLMYSHSIRAGDGPIKLMRIIKNPLSQYLPFCPKFSTSYSSDDLVHPKDLAKSEPVVISVGAMAHGSVKPDYTERCVSISQYPLSAALVCAKLCTAFEEQWGVK